MRTALVAVIGLAMGTWTTSALADGGAPGASPRATDPPAQPAPASPAAQPAPAPAGEHGAPAPAGEHGAPAAAGEHGAPPPAGAHGAHHGEHGGEHAHGEGHHHGEHAGHHAEEEEEEEGDSLKAGVDTVFGFGRLEPGFDRSYVTSFVLGAQYHFAPYFNLGLKWPVVVGSLAGEADKAAVANIGNIEIGPEVEIPLTHGIKLPIELGIALPTAGGDPFHPSDEGARRAAQLNEVAARIRGGEETSLFAANRFGLIPRLALEIEKGPIEAGLYTKAELLFKAGGNEPAENTHFERKSPAVEWITGASLYWRAIPKHFSLGVRGWFEYIPVETAERVALPACSESLKTNCTPEGTEEPSKTKFVLEPSLKFQAGAFRSSLGYILPLAGDLAKDGYGGVRLYLGGVY
jgi:hypothetical protein